MAVKQIPNLPVAVALSGTEQLEAVQNGVSVRLTASALAELASQGAPGPPGPTGPAGPQGAPGPTGPTGPAGPEGPQGDTGPQGPQGVEGPGGPAGEIAPIIGSFGQVRTPDELPPSGFIPANWDGPGAPPNAYQMPLNYALIYNPANVVDLDYGDLFVFVGTSEYPAGWVNAGNIRGPQGVQGIQGVTGQQGEEGPMGPSGPTGPQGIQGETGPAGLQGDAGPQGVPGPEGPEGPAGAQGDQGVEGPVGPPGEIAPIIGSFGAQTVPADLPPDGLIPADFDGPGKPAAPFQMTLGYSLIYLPPNITNPASGDLYVWVSTAEDATGWVNAGNLQGPQGVQGEQGPQGIQGVPGGQGIQGIQGPAGIEGPVGSQGDVGPEGPTGPAGPQGIQGVPGVEGPQGVEGPIGPPGQTAPIVGSFGQSKTPADLPPDGFIPANWDAPGVPPSDYQMRLNYALLYNPPSTSDPGYGDLYVFVGMTENAAGWSNAGNIQGPQGVQGEQGVQGAQGATGPTGSDGPTGPEGPEGPAGPAGPQGDVGSTGPEGAEGPIGETGPQGPQGPQGDTPTSMPALNVTVNPAVAGGPNAQYALQNLDANKLDLAGGAMTGRLYSVAPTPAFISRKGAPAGWATFAGQNEVGAPRWMLHLASPTPETGNDTGSELILQGVKDDGSFIWPLTVYRATGVFSFAQIPVLPEIWPTAANQAVSKAYADTFLPLSGGTVNGFTQFFSDAGLGISAATSAGDSIVKVDAGGSGHVSAVLGRKGNAARWQIDLGDAVPETGGNTGSNFTISRFDDLQDLIGNPLSISRASGVVTFTQTPTINGVPIGSGYLPLSGGTLTGDLTISEAAATINLNKTGPAAGCTVQGQHNNATRWQLVLGDSAPDTGGNAGSDFNIARYDDAGDFLSTPLLIQRSTGVVFMDSLVVPAINVAGDSPAVAMNVVGAGYNLIYGARDSAFRWLVYLGDAATETGSNAGTNFSIQNCADNGAVLGVPLSIDRATGVVNFSETPTVDGAPIGSKGQPVLAQLKTDGVSNSIEFPTIFSDNPDVYEFEITFVNLGFNAALQALGLQVYVAGTWQSAGYLSAGSFTTSNSSGFTTPSPAGVTYIAANNNIANPNPGASGYTRVSETDSTSFVKVFNSRFAFPNGTGAAPQIASGSCGWWGGSNAAIQGFRITNLTSVAAFNAGGRVTVCAVSYKPPGYVS